MSPSATTTPPADPAASVDTARTSPDRRSRHAPPLWAAATVVVPALVALLLTAFGWAAVNLAPRDLPLGVAGSEPATAAITTALEQEPDAIDIHRYADQAAAERAIESRDIYGAVVATPEGPVVLTATGASPTVAQLLTQQGQQLAAASGHEVTVVDVVPGTDDDPRGTAFGAMALPLVLGGVALGAAAVLLGRSRRERASMLVAGSVIAGYVGVGIAQGWLGILGGSWVANGAVLSFALLAGAAGAAGLAALLGRAGIVVAAATYVVVSNPFSGIASAPELLPEPWGAIGQWLPLGAGGSMLRSTSFFDGAGIGGSALVLTLWVVNGLALVLFARRIARRR
jgi:hypothetical protein